MPSLLGSLCFGCGRRNTIGVLDADSPMQIARHSLIFSANRQIADKKKAPEGAFNQALNLIRMKLEGKRPLRFNFDLRTAVEIALQEWR